MGKRPRTRLARAPALLILPEDFGPPCVTSGRSRRPTPGEARRRVSRAAHCWPIDQIRRMRPEMAAASAGEYPDDMSLGAPLSPHAPSPSRTLALHHRDIEARYRTMSLSPTRPWLSIAGSPGPHALSARCHLDDVIYDRCCFGTAFRLSFDVDICHVFHPESCIAALRF
jgi:hypothetical protein